MGRRGGVSSYGKLPRTTLSVIDETLAEFVQLECQGVAINEETGEVQVFYGGIDWRLTAKSLAAELSKEREGAA